MTHDSHPLRASLTDEMHLRKFPSLGAPAQILQVLVMVDAGSETRVRAHLASQFPEAGLPETAKYFRGRIGEADFVWERHTEFMTYTFILSAGGRDEFWLDPFGETATEWRAQIPGQVMRSSRVTLLSSRWVAPATHADIRRHFSPEDLIVCDVAQGRARLYSDFRLHGDAGRAILVDQGLEGHEASLLVQSLLELGNYRKMALFGLPVARGVLSAIDRLEPRLAGLTRAISGASSPQADLLHELSDLSTDIATILAESKYRLSASRAYGELVRERLQSMAVTPVRGWMELGEFTQRRLLPALRTCRSASERLDDLHHRSQSTSALLRTRLDMALAEQNIELLQSLDQRGHAQLKLQQTVEGLSVAAISYYVLGLVSYLAKASHAVFEHVQSDVIVAALAPFVVAGVWLKVRQHTQRLH
jgi:uncharacterized membrane-anchored protein